MPQRFALNQDREIAIHRHHHIRHTLRQSHRAALQVTAPALLEAVVVAEVAINGRSDPYEKKVARLLKKPLESWV